MIERPVSVLEVHRAWSLEGDHCITNLLASLTGAGGGSPFKNIPQSLRYAKEPPGVLILGLLIGDPDVMLDARQVSLKKGIVYPTPAPACDNIFKLVDET